MYSVCTSYLEAYNAWNNTNYIGTLEKPGNLIIVVLFLTGETSPFIILCNWIYQKFEISIGFLGPGVQIIVLLLFNA